MFWSRLIVPGDTPWQHDGDAALTGALRSELLHRTLSAARGIGLGWNHVEYFH
jgi:hypothetical protein